MVVVDLRACICGLFVRSIRQYPDAHTQHLIKYHDQNVSLNAWPFGLKRRGWLNWTSEFHWSGLLFGAWTRLISKGNSFFSYCSYLELYMQKRCDKKTDNIWNRNAIDVEWKLTFGWFCSSNWRVKNPQFEFAWRYFRVAHFAFGSYICLIKCVSASTIAYARVHVRMRNILFYVLNTVIVSETNTSSMRSPIRTRVHIKTLGNISIETSAR